jgi:hypothetical protein
MFNETSVGKTVVGKHKDTVWCSKGIISAYRPKKDNQIEVQFVGGGVAYFNKYGVCCIGDEKYDIILEEQVSTNKTYTFPESQYNNQIVIDNQFQDITPEILAELFWNLNSEEQARFYNHLDTVADFIFPFQLQSITDEEGLTLAGRRVM